MLPLAEADWLQAWGQYGLPTVILAVVAAAVYYAARVVWRDIVIPLRDKVVARVNGFFDKVDDALVKMGAFHSGHVEALRHQEKALVRQEDILWRVVDLVQGVDDLCLQMLTQRGLTPRRRGKQPRADPAAPNAGGAP